MFVNEHTINYKNMMDRQELGSGSGEEVSDLESQPDLDAISRELETTEISAETTVDSSLLDEFGLAPPEAEQTFTEYDDFLGKEALAKAVGGDIFDSLKTKETASVTEAVREIMLQASEKYTEQSAQAAQVRELATLSDEELLNRFNKVICSGRGLTPPVPGETYGDYRCRLGQEEINTAVVLDALASVSGEHGSVETEIKEQAGLADMMRAFVKAELESKAQDKAQETDSTAKIVILEQMPDEEVIKRFDRALLFTRREGVKAMVNRLMEGKPEKEAVLAEVDQMSLLEVTQMERTLKPQVELLDTYIRHSEIEVPAPAETRVELPVANELPDTVVKLVAQLEQPKVDA